MRRLFQEPLLHFVLLGMMLFALDAFLGERTVEAGGGDIVVSRGRIENLAALFAKTWQRPPTAEELRGLVDDYVLEEALYREGVALGVDTDDTIIRRRVRQKMEFVVDDVVELAEPTDADLEAWLAEHADSYARTEGQHPALAEVRGVVARDWSYAQREQVSKRFYEELLERYRVSIEWPQDGMTDEAAPSAKAHE